MYPFQKCQNSAIVMNQHVRISHIPGVSQVPSVIVEPGDVIYVPENWWRSFWSARVTFELFDVEVDSESLWDSDWIPTGMELLMGFHGE